MEQQERTFRIGPIRPPSEANSLLLQVTNGCTWNKCKFCQLYRLNTKFKAYSADSIKADIDNIAYQADIIRRYQTPLGAWDIDGPDQELGTDTVRRRTTVFVTSVANWLVGGGENVFSAGWQHDSPQQREAFRCVDLPEAGIPPALSGSHHMDVQKTCRGSAQKNMQS